jgi:hypothetical protein
LKNSKSWVRSIKRTCLVMMKRNSTTAARVTIRESQNSPLLNLGLLILTI